MWRAFGDLTWRAHLKRSFGDTIQQTDDLACKYFGEDIPIRNLRNPKNNYWNKLN